MIHSRGVIESRRFEHGPNIFSFVRCRIQDGTEAREIHPMPRGSCARQNLIRRIDWAQLKFPHSQPLFMSYATFGLSIR